MKRRGETASLRKLGFRVTEVERKLIEGFAKAHNMTVADYLRRRALHVEHKRDYSFGPEYLTDSVG